jgi:DNA-binding CsgD family transcriptional regulator
MQTQNLSNNPGSLSHDFPHLIIHAEDGDQLFPLTNADFWTIGRGFNNSIVLNDKWASRNHATLQIVRPPNYEAPDSFGSLTAGDADDRNETTEQKQPMVGNFYLVDLGSRNGSFLRGQRVTFPILLKNGDRLTIGKTDMDFYSPYKPETKKGNVPEGMHLFQQPTAPVSRSTLTPSEERVFWQVVQGFTNKEIGKRLQISPRTVQTHLSSIMTKLNLENRSQIVRFAFEHSHRPPNSSDTY